MIGFEIYGLAAANGVKVVLSGQGADEVIAGYPNYFDAYWLWLLRVGRLPQLWREVEAFGHVHGRSRMALLRRTLRQFCGHLLRRSATYRALGSRRRQAALRANPWFTPDVDVVDLDGAADLHGTLNASLRRSVERAPLPLYLRLEDRNSMAHSVEARLPFMDYRLVSMVFQLAPEWKLRGPWNKYVLREAMHGCIPESVRTRADKMGFPVPAAQWFRTVLYEPMQDLLASERTRTRGLYNVDAIRRDLQKHRDGLVDVADALFNVAQLESWFTLDGHEVAVGTPAFAFRCGQDEERTYVPAPPPS
jgi:asparagine synthase (glutamine-hydrolysing)